MAPVSFRVSFFGELDDVVIVADSFTATLDFVRFFVGQEPVAAFRSTEVFSVVKI